MQATMFRNLGLILIAALLSGCLSTDAAPTMQAAWLGRSADDFFIQYGPPYSEHTLSDGRVIYLWTGGQKNYHLPGTASTTSNIIGGTVYSSTTFSGGSTIDVECVAQIVALPDQTIVEIKPYKDTIGEWALSRCQEIFGQ
jgi:hypothetical protein